MLLEAERLKNARIRAARDHAAAVEKYFMELVGKEYPPGVEVSYLKHGFTPQRAIVKEVYSGDNILVRNIDNHKEIRISYYHILEAEKAYDENVNC